jgi:hypothetical protein
MNNKTIIKKEFSQDCLVRKGLPVTNSLRYLKKICKCLYLPPTFFCRPGV